jgi:hypothetical protein
MKYLFFILIFAIYGCNEDKPTYVNPSKNVTSSVMNNPNFQIVTVDSCEYVLYCSQKSRDYSGAWASGLTHKGNCKYCRKRNNN